MILVTEEERAQEERKKKRYLLLYVVIACVYVAGSLLLLFLSPNEYIPFLLGDIFLSIDFGVFSVFFFTVAYAFVKSRSGLFNKVLAALPEREYARFLKKGDTITEDGVEMRKYHFLIREDEREVRAFPEDLPLEEGKRYLVEIRAGVLVEIGECDV